MAKESNIQYVPTFSVVGLLGIVFVTLKLCGVIDWSWVWVTAPFWLPAAMWLMFFVSIPIIAGILLLAGIVIAAFEEKRRK